MRSLLFLLASSLSLAQTGADLGLWFVRWPEPITAPVGDDVVFECSVNVPAESVRWRQGDHWLQQDRPPPPRPTSTSRLLVKFEDEKQEGDYQCVAWFGASALASTPARLTLAELQPFLYQPQKEVRVTPGNTVAIACPPPVSKPPAVIQYLQDGTIMPESSNTLATTGTLILPNVTAKDSGVYTCTATNYITGMVINSPMKVILKVEKSNESGSPRFLYQPQTKYTVQAGQNISLECCGIGNPVPVVSWRRVNSDLPIGRSEQIPGGLRIASVQLADQGQYVCELKNGVPPMIAQLITLDVQVPPMVSKGPSNAVVEEDSDTELTCEATGSPTPNITWFLNGESVLNDSHITPQGGNLIIKKIQKKHAGIYQCFATNAAGVTFGAAMIQVSPTQVTAGDPPPYLPEIDSNEQSESSTTPGPGRGRKKDHTRKSKDRRREKKHRNNVMIPPTRPNITRLSNKSVMVRWSVPPNPGLPIQFFKVQYQDLDSSGKHGQWMTSNEDIQPHINSYEVDGLITGHHYRFRIAAVYSNNDNKLGRTSSKFHLNRGPSNDETPFFPPNLTYAESLSPTSIRIHWEYLNSVLAPVDGFYVYYRATTSAGDYIKATAEGQNTRSYLLSHLAPDTHYDIKMQSFTVRAASDFSVIISAKTLKEINATTAPEVVEASGLGDKSSHGQLYLVLGAVISGLALICTLAGGICICYRRSAAQQDHGGDGCDKSGVEGGLTIQQLEPVALNGFSHGRAVTNGFIPCSINITNNPLADSHQDKNAMELSCMRRHNNNCPSGAPAQSGSDWCTPPPIMARTGENYV
ncbi:interference hedgehog [Halyomorpha halys]|uniref:interference hedgehog n=1 Tax=Halyomorpha halys TaxID=286706 RepID=UPI0006D4DC42|nr:interference hedgehog [Halyomorpha halys]